MIELKPCPFCGEEPRGIIDGRVFYDCGADNWLEGWNTRDRELDIDLREELIQHIEALTDLVARV